MFTQLNDGEISLNPNPPVVRAAAESGSAAPPPPHSCSASPFCTGVSDFAEQFILSQKTNPCISHSRSPIHPKFLTRKVKRVYTNLCAIHTHSTYRNH